MDFGGGDVVELRAWTVDVEDGGVRGREEEPDTFLDPGQSDETREGTVDVQVVKLEHIGMRVGGANHQAGISLLWRRGLALRGSPERRGRTAESGVSGMFMETREGRNTYSDLSTRDSER